MAALAREREVPLVAPFTVRLRTGFPLNRFVFYLLSDLEADGGA